MEYVMYASAAVWLGLGLYVVLLAGRQQCLAARLRVLESDRGQA